MTTALPSVSRRTILLSVGAGLVLSGTPLPSFADPSKVGSVGTLPSQVSVLTPSGRLLTIPKFLGFSLDAGRTPGAVTVQVTFDPRVYRTFENPWCVDAAGNTHELSVRSKGAGAMEVRTSSSMPPGISATIFLGGLLGQDTVSVESFAPPSYDVGGARGRMSAQSLPSSVAACLMSLVASWTPGRPGELRSLTGLALTARGTGHIPAGTRLYVYHDARHFGPLVPTSNDFRLLEQKRLGRCWQQTFALRGAISAGQSARLRTSIPHVGTSSDAVEPTALGIILPAGASHVRGGDALLEPGRHPEAR